MGLKLDVRPAFRESMQRLLERSALLSSASPPPSQRLLRCACDTRLHVRRRISRGAEAWRRASSPVRLSYTRATGCITPATCALGTTTRRISLRTYDSLRLSLS
jgi:hypothetical protein